MKPPGIGVCQTSSPVWALTAHSMPFQSPKYATPPTTAGVPDTPLIPSFDHAFVSFWAVAAVILCSFGLKRVLARSCAYTGQSFAVPVIAVDPLDEPLVSPLEPHEAAASIKTVASENHAGARSQRFSMEHHCRVPFRIGTGHHEITARSRDRAEQTFSKELRACRSRCGRVLSVELGPGVVDHRGDLGFGEARRERRHSTPSAVYDGRLVCDAHSISDTGESRPEVPFAVGAMTARTLSTKDAGPIGFSAGRSRCGIRCRGPIPAAPTRPERRDCDAPGENQMARLRHQAMRTRFGGEPRGPC
jgi:hypothetical protein